MGESSITPFAPVPPDMVAERFPIPREELAEFCRRNHITRLSLFGSVLREDFRSDSDIDVLVEFKPGHVPGYLRLGGMSVDLSEKTGNRFVDIKTPRALSRHLRQDVIDSAEPLYVED